MERITKPDKYESELEKCTQLLNKYWPESMSCNGYLQVAGHLENILTRQPDTGLVKALESIASGTCDDVAPYRCAPASELKRLAVNALAKYKEKD